MNKCIKCTVVGNVQGVFFRQNARDRAIQLGVKGWTRNLQDGRVEVMALGEDTKLVDLKNWLWEGSPEAKVEQVQCEEIEEEVHYNSFEIRI